MPRATQKLKSKAGAEKGSMRRLGGKWHTLECIMVKGAGAYLDFEQGKGQVPGDFLD
jgi:hypothetical protein